MILLKQIRLSRFRNFNELDLQFAEGLNAIVGPNAIGKTTLLEAIHFISIGRSFRTTKLQEVIKKGESSFTIQAFFEKDGVDQTIAIFYDGTNKEIRHNQTTYQSFSPLLGLFPTVVYSPFDIELIHGAPPERRRFLNIFISQADPLYIYYLTRYTRSLLQRNALLKKRERKTIEIWEGELIKASLYIQEKRAKALETLSNLAKNYYQELSNNSEELKLIYKPSNISPEIFEKSREKELLLGYTLVGPHRDDIEITLQTLSARNYASEGQKRTIIAAIKLAETEILQPAILLIDDFGIHLDQTRKTKFEEKIASHQQVFLTSPFHIMSTHSRTLCLEVQKISL